MGAKQGKWCFPHKANSRQWAEDNGPEQFADLLQQWKSINPKAQNWAASEESYTITVAKMSCYFILGKVSEEETTPNGIGHKNEIFFSPLSWPCGSHGEEPQQHDV